MRGLLKDTPISDKVRPLMWNWLKEKWGVLYSQFSTTMSLLGIVVKCVISGNIGEAFALSVEAWMNGEDLSTESAKIERKTQLLVVDRNISQALEEVRANTNWVVSSRDDLRDWAEERQILPDWIVPVNYKIDCTPDFTTFRFTGSVDILFFLLTQCHCRGRCRFHIC